MGLIDSALQYLQRESRVVKQAPVVLVACAVVAVFGGFSLGYWWFSDRLAFCRERLDACPKQAEDAVLKELASVKTDLARVQARQEPRHLTDEQKAELARALGSPPNSKCSVDIYCNHYDNEGCSYARDLQAVLVLLGWTAQMGQVEPARPAGLTIVANPDDQAALRLEVAFKKLNLQVQRREEARAPCSLGLEVGDRWY